MISKAKLPEIIEAIIRLVELRCSFPGAYSCPSCSSLTSPDSEATPNTLVLVGHGINKDLARLEEMKISKLSCYVNLTVDKTDESTEIPHNVLILDTAAYERALYTAGLRGMMGDSLTGRARMPGTTLSLDNMLLSLISNPPRPQPTSPSTEAPTPVMTTPPPIVLPSLKLHNSGNDAFMTLYGLQVFLNPLETEAPVVVPKARQHRPSISPYGGAGYSPMMMMPVMGYPMVSPGLPGMTPSSSAPNLFSLGNKDPRRHSAYDLSDELGQLNLGAQATGGGGTTRSKSGPIMTMGTLGSGQSVTLNGKRRSG